MKKIHTLIDKKRWLFLIALVAAAMMAGSLQSQDWGLTNFQRWRVEGTCRFLTARYGGDRDAAEAALMAAGYPVMDTQEPYPAYLANADDLTEFLRNPPKNGLRKIYQVAESGRVGCMVFRFSDGKPYFSGWGTQWEERPILDWALTEEGTFYYQLYPSDKHYMTYASISTAAPDRELCDLTDTYIRPVSYQAVNLFLVDWREGEWGTVNFNDLLEYFYYMENGEKIDPMDYPYRPGGPTYMEIPADLFEKTLLPYFDMSRETLRTLGHYDPAQDCYPWLDYDMDNQIWFPKMEPRVTECTENADGTLTLTVEVSSRDQKTDRFFTHETTVRPLENGRFQYVSNRVTQVSDYGLPFAISRQELYGT